MANILCRLLCRLLCRKVSFGYDGTERNVFTDLDLVIDTGWRTALTGRNGRGKTTLLRLIHGELAPDRGGIEGPVDVRRFPVPVTDPTISGFEAAKDAAGPFRRWEREMARLLDTGDDGALARYGTLQTRFQEAGGYELTTSSSSGARPCSPRSASASGQATVSRWSARTAAARPACSSCLVGAPLVFEGTFTRPARLDIARVRQQPGWTTGSLAEHLVAAGMDESRLRQVMAALGVRGATLERSLESMSPGQRK